MDYKSIYAFFYTIMVHDNAILINVINDLNQK